MDSFFDKHHPRRFQQLLSFSLVLVAALNSGCGGAVSDDADASSQDLFLGNGAKWTTTAVPVCWMEHTTTARTLRHRDLVRTAADRTWQTNSSVSFTGWGECHGPTRGVRISVDAGYWPQSAVGDPGGPSSEATMLLNFSFTGNAEVSKGFRGCQKNDSELDTCINFIAAHEFGHALGFLHEQGRSDTPSWCAHEKGDHGIELGKWDRFSIMNYCNPAWNGNGQLSAGDIAGVQKVYGKPGTHGLVRGQALIASGVRFSLDGRFELSMEPDGNLLLLASRGAFWSSGTGGHPGAKLELQVDGNMVIYSASGHPIWGTHTPNEDGARLVVQSDGRLVLYSVAGKALWSAP